MVYNLPNKIKLNQARDLICCAQFIIRNPLSSASSSEIRENYSICMFMLASYKAGRIEYPTVIEILGHNDPPDFRIRVSTPPVIIGLEHTTATKDSFLVADKEMQRDGDYILLESSCYTFKNALPSKRAFDGLIKKDDSLTGPPFFGNAHLTNWVDFVYEAYKTKSQKSIKPSKNEFDSYELLVEVAIPNMIGNEHDKALTMLKDKIATESGNIPAIYHKLHIFSQGHVIIDALGENEIIKFSKKDIKFLWEKLEKIV